MMEISISLHIHSLLTLDQTIWINIPRLTMVMICQNGYGSTMATTEKTDKLLLMLDLPIEKLLNIKHQLLTLFQNISVLNSQILLVLKMDITEI